MSDEMKTINLSVDSADSKKQILRSPLANQSSRELGRQLQENGDNGSSSSIEIGDLPEEDSLSSLHKLTFRTGDKKSAKYPLFFLGIVLLAICFLCASWLVSSNSITKMQNKLYYQVSRLQEKGISLIGRIQGNSRGNINESRSEQQADLRNTIDPQTTNGVRGIETDPNCNSTGKDSPHNGENKFPERTRIVDCYLLYDMPIKALHSFENVGRSTANKDDILDTLMDIQVKYRLWYPPSAFKNIRNGCNRWESKPDCASRLTLDGYYRSHLNPENGFQIMTKNLENFPLPVRTHLWLSGGRIAMFEGRYAAAEDRLKEADKLASPNAPGLLREITETRVINSYYGKNKTLTKQLVDNARMTSITSAKDSLTNIELLQGLASSRDARQKRSALIKFMALNQSGEKLRLDPLFLNVLGFEAIINGAQEAYLSYLSRVKQTFGNQKEISRHLSLLLDQWAVRSRVSVKQVQGAKVTLIKYKKEHGVDPFFTHFSIAYQIKLNSLTKGVVPITGEMQQALAQKNSLPWQTQYILGLALIKGDRLAEMPGLLSTFEHQATLLDAKRNLFLLKVEYLIAQKKFELAHKNLALFLTRYPDYLRALEIKKSLMPIRGDNTELTEVNRKIEEIFMSDKYSDKLNQDPMGAFALID